MRNDRWSNDGEIKNALHCFTKDKRAAGPILYHQNGNLYVHDKEGHAIILGVSGSGKSRRCTMAMTRTFIEAGESFVVIDPKGEIYYETGGLVGNDYDVHVIDFRNIFDSECWNPLALPYELYTSGDPVKRQIALEMVDEMSFALFPVSQKADPFWAESARSVFVAVVVALFEHAEPGQVTMASAHQIIARGEERLGGNTALKEFVASLPDDSVSAMLLQSYVNTANDTRAGIRSTYLQGLAMFARSEGVMQMMGSDDLHINGLDGEKKVGIYIILPDERANFDRVAGILCGQLMSHYMRLAQDKFNGRLAHRLNVCLEELGNIGEAISNNLPHLMSAGRSRNIRVQCVLQSLSQLDQVFGSSNATTILSNADVMVAFRVNHWDTLTELSHKCGEREVDNGTHVNREPLINQSQLASMETGQALVMISGRTKFITWLPDYREMFDFSDWAPPQRKPAGSKQQVSTFDVVECAKKLRQKKTEAMMSQMPRPIPRPAPTEWWRDAPSVPAGASPAGLPELNIDELVANIDAQIAALEEEMQQEAASPHNVVVEDCGGKLAEVAEEIAAACGLSVVQVKKKLQGGTASFRLPNKAEAGRVKERIAALGGAARIEKASG